LVAGVTRADALPELMANTEDAYGFPPYAQLAPQIVLEGEGYDDLRLKERAILSSALQAAEVTRLRVDDFSWPEMIRARSEADTIQVAEVETVQMDSQPLMPARVPVASGTS